MNTKLLILCTYIILLIALTNCNSDSNISEVEPKEEQPELYQIDTAVVWTAKHNPYLLKKDTKIFNGGSLTILEGVDIFLFEEVEVYELSGNYFRYPVFDVQGGTINCFGTEYNRIRMLDSSGASIVGAIYFESFDHQHTKSVIKGIEARLLYYWDGREVYVQNSIIEEITVRDKIYQEVMYNYIGEYRGGGTGIIQGNHFERQASLQFDSSLVTENVFESTYSGLRCALGAKTRVIGNTFKNCNQAITIFLAKPTIHDNNIFVNKVNILIKPNEGNPQFDTVYATNNWWGTTDSTEILNKIKYETYMNTISGKHIQFVPFAEEPFDL